ncbi:hypothetical protein [Magnetospirillum sp. UT-4]|uniref:hypothetical protein n=1 Tax=Magnetospirillum sp. UT-4 TaxID=2681467 RepID=UPI00157207DD|nr:hypothetical protein [Magnetospirillum sp. UT-4]
MRPLALRLVLLVAAVMLGAWPAVADLGRHPGPAQARGHAMAGHRMDAPQHATHSGHAEMGERQAAACQDGSAGMVPGHCGSWVMACGTGVAGTLPAVIELAALVPVAIVHRHAPGEISVAHSVPPTLRPPRFSA